MIPIDDVSNLCVRTGITSLSDTGQRQKRLLTSEPTVFIHVCEEGILFQLPDGETQWEINDNPPWEVRESVFSLSAHSDSSRTSLSTPCLSSVTPDPGSL